MTERNKGILPAFIALELVPEDIARGKGIETDVPIFLPRYSEVVIPFNEGQMVEADQIEVEHLFGSDDPVASSMGFLAYVTIDKADIYSVRHQNLDRFVSKRYSKARKMMVETIFAYCGAKDKSLHRSPAYKSSKPEDIVFKDSGERIFEGLIIRAGDSLIPICGEGVHPNNPEFVIANYLRDPNRVASFAYQFSRREGKLVVEPYQA